MGINDWRNKDEKDYTAEDDIVSGADLIPWGKDICVSFYWREFRFDIWECWHVYLYEKNEITMDKYIDKVWYDDCESMMLDKHWDGLSLSDIMSKIPSSALFTIPEFFSLPERTEPIENYINRKDDSSSS